MNLFIISHVIQIWIFPPGLNLFLAIIAAILWRWRPLFAKICIIFSFASLWLFSMPIFSQQLVDNLQYMYPLLNINAINKNVSHQAIVILGGGDEKVPNETKRIVSQGTLNRLRYAVHLYQTTHIPILVSGSNADLSYTEADAMADELKNAFNVPVKWKEDKGVNTAEESKYILPILIKNNINTIYLVTDAWHMPRSMYIFNKTFKDKNINIIAAPMGYGGLQDEYKVLNYLPSLTGLNASQLAIHEYIGMLWYRFYYT